MLFLQNFFFPRQIESSSQALMPLEDTKTRLDQIIEELDAGLRVEDVIKPSDEYAPDFAHPSRYSSQSQPEASVFAKTVCELPTSHLRNFPDRF